MGAPDFLVIACQHYAHLSANGQQHVFLYGMNWVEYATKLPTSGVPT